MRTRAKWIDPSVLWPAAIITGLMPLLALVAPVLRYDHILARGETWSAWDLTPGVTLPTLLVLWLYFAGQRAAAARAESRLATARHFAFFGGVAALFLALQSPIESLADHLFVAHQVEHMLLRTVGPMLIVAASPQAALLRGLPSALRRKIVAPLIASPPVRALRLLGRPAPATALFIGTTYFWMIPRYHDIAILDEPVHYLWHITLLLSGLIFFWRILDSRPYPLGASLGVRLFMFWLASVGNILLGSYLSFKHEVLYHAYAEMGRLWAIAPAVDEQIGGLTMWIPGCMMFAGTAMLMIYRWAQQEDRAAARQHAAGRPAPTVAEFVASRRDANRRMALGLLAFAATVLAITLAVAVIYHYSGTRAGEIFF